VYQFAHQQMGARRLLGALAVVAMLGAACSSDDDDGAGDDGAVDTSVLGELDLAEGEPFKVGYAVDAGGEAVDTSENKVAGEATQEYINRHLGGIAGRPLDITFCDTRNSSATATECINQFVQGGMSAIFVSSSGNGETLASEAAEAGIPYVVYLGATAPELTNPNSFSLSGSAVSILGGPGIVMQQRELTKLGLLTIDVPTATQAVQLLATPAYRAAGLELELIPVPPGTADMSANVASALDSEMWLVLGDAAFCTTALDAIQTQAPDTPIFMAQACVSADSAADLPKGYEGVLTSGSIRLDPSDPEEDLFRAVLAEYSPGDLGGRCFRHGPRVRPDDGGLHGRWRAGERGRAPAGSHGLAPARWWDRDRLRAVADSDPHVAVLDGLLAHRARRRRQPDELRTDRRDPVLRS